MAETHASPKSDKIDRFRPIPVKYNEVLCIGLGLSGLCLGIQLKRKYGFTDIHLYDRNASYSGTWFANNYPGCACDIPAVFYSYSFEINPSWSRLFPSKDEIKEYLDGVVEKYQLGPYMTFRTECESAKWDSERQIWSVHLRDLVTGARHTHECRLLFSAVGVLVDPKPSGIPGEEVFEGSLFHTARWRKDVDLMDKDVVVIGNGCSGTQVVSQIVPKSGTLTQFINTPHWLVERANTKFGHNLRWAFRNIPLLARLLRFIIFLSAENDWRLFIMNNSGARMRRAHAKASTEYILRAAPGKYHGILTPDWEFACKRRVFDSDGEYTAALHAPNMHLIQDQVLEIFSRSVRTATKTYPADVIILATGFQTNNGLGPLRIQGRDGEWLEDHWAKEGGPGAYNGTAMHGYPNFFIIYGPNASTGHSSVLMTIENMVNYALKIAEPVIKGRAVEVEVTAEAEKEYGRKLQAASSGRLWTTCHSWYVKNGRNSTLYPWSQLYFYYRSILPTWKDWKYKYTSSNTRRLGLRYTLLLILLTCGAAGVMKSRRDPQWYSVCVKYASELVQTARERAGV